MGKETAKKTPNAPLSFEEAMDSLSTIVHTLEEGQVGLSESLQQYEQGVKLLKHCHQLLHSAERRIEVLSGVDEQGEVTTEPFEDGEQESLQEKSAARSRRRSSTSGKVSQESTPNQGSSDLDDGPTLF